MPVSFLGAFLLLFQKSFIIRIEVTLVSALHRLHAARTTQSQFSFRRRALDPFLPLLPPPAPRRSVW